MTLEDVAASLGKKHSTISRWECGKLPLTINALEALARLYGASRSQVLAAPEHRDLVARLDEVQKIIEALDPEDLEHWLATGRALGRVRNRDSG